MEEEPKDNAAAEGNGVTGRLFSRGPKRVLAIDGGRGMLTAGVLAALETRLRRRSGRRDFRLCDYFDLIGGAASGALAAAALAIGKSAAELADIHREMALENERRASPEPAKLDAVLAREFGEATLGSDALRTGVAFFAKRPDTGEDWPITNNPRARTWASGENGPALRDVVVRKLVHASMAAPDFGDGFTNPSLRLLLLATLRGYGFEWTTGPDRLLMVSVGAGFWPHPPGGNPAAMRQDASLTAITVLQGMSTSARPWRIDSHVGEMEGATLSPVPALHFQRMDGRLDLEALAALGLQYGAAELALLRDASAHDSATLARLYEVGLRCGERYFAPGKAAGASNPERAILPRRFDPPGFSGPGVGPPGFKLEALGRAWKGGE